MKSLLRAGVAALILSSCATVTITRDNGRRLSGSADYSESKPFFLWGLAGEHDVDVVAICREKAVEQMQTQTTFVDGLLGSITLGIYAPRTAKVWCAR